MLYFYSTRESNPENKKRIEKSLKSTNVRIEEFVNPGTHSLTECYNIALDMALDDEIIVFAHDDIILENGWDVKLTELFQKSDYGIIGVAGTTSLSNTGIWWDKRSDLAGIVSHEKKEGGKTIRYDTKFSEKHDFIMPVCCVDGVFFAVKKDRIKAKFNEELTGFHFYDVGFSVDNFVKEVKIGVTTSFRIHHKSVGQITNSWQIIRNTFLRLYATHLPLSVEPAATDLFIPESVNLSPIKVGVIILTKDKINYVVDCVDSLFAKTSKEIQLTVYIGDTGSTDESLFHLNNYVAQHNNIKVIHIPKYNFAKNNNQILNENFSDEELILFCNNDIKLINNALDLMVNQYQRNKKGIGTIGCRLLYDNNRVQHGGIVIFGTDRLVRGATHIGLKTYYLAKSSIEHNVLGCTGAFLAINKELFTSLGGFDENTEECFEDVILNIETKCKKNKRNCYVGSAVCYHYESLTRNESPTQLERVNKDFVNILIPKIKSYFNILKSFIIQVK